MTGFVDGLLAVLLAVCWNAMIAFRIKGAFPVLEGGFVARTFVQTLVLRYVGAVALNAYATSSSFANAFWGDSITYDHGGWLLALRWSGETYLSPYISSAVSGFGFQYLVGALYYVFGRNQLLVQFVNGTLGALSVVVIYAIARELFDAAAARWAALFMAFFPQMIFWSCAMYKDPSILLCIAVSMWAVLKLRERFTAGHILFYLGSLLILMTLRFYVFYMVAFATLGTFVFTRRRAVFAGFLGQAVLVGLFLAAMAFGVRRETVEQQTSYFDLERVQTARAGQIMVGQSGFGEEIDVSTPEGALSAIPVGLVYLLFAPFPWQISGLRQLLTVPETLVWYALMPALWRGLVHTVGSRFREALPILVFAGTLTMAYAIFQSNVGTAYRQRTQVAMFFFVFMGVGLGEKERRKLATRARALSA